MAKTASAEILLHSAAESTNPGTDFTPPPEGVAPAGPVTGAAASVGVPADGAVEPPAGAEPEVPVTAANINNRAPNENGHSIFSLDLGVI